MGNGYPMFEAEDGRVLIYVSPETRTWLSSDDGGHSWTTQTLTPEELQERYKKNSKRVSADVAYASLIVDAGDARGNNSRLLGFEWGADGVYVCLSYDWGAPGRTESLCLLLSLCV